MIYDVTTYQIQERWHYRILQVKASVGSAPVVFESRAENRQGYETQGEALKAGMARRDTLLKAIA
jgi:hypothetical protein